MIKDDYDYEKEKAQNDLQREVFIHKILCELQVDLMVCKCLSIILLIIAIIIYMFEVSLIFC